MTWLRHRWLPVSLLVAAAGLLAASLVWVGGAGWGPSGVGPGHMMGSVGIAGDGPVRNLDDAQRAAARFADRWGLTVGEVMKFDNGFYAELADPSGALATEVLIDPDAGDVQIEYGPAMMWNITYGMHPRPGDETVSAEQAAAIADQWLETNRAGEHAADVDAFPATTRCTRRGDQVVGMVSV
jgi:hypothetical protein